MNLFDLPQAKHFCKPLAAPPVSVGQSLMAFHDAVPSSVTHIQEGDFRFEAYRVALLNSVERWLLYSRAHHRRALDMLVPVSAPWVHVTLYYSSFFAANAILGMFGGWVGTVAWRNRVVEVSKGAIGSQEFRIHRKLPPPNRATGSQRVFWDFFYDAVPNISSWAPPSLAAALTPVVDINWQPNQRNDVNYDMLKAWEASTAFNATFKVNKFPKSLGGSLAQQIEATERMIALGISFAKTLSINSFGLDGCGAGGTRLQIEKRLVTQKIPKGMVARSALQRFS